jgi:hypothetical protein
MNIFWLDNDPVKCAQYHNNKHVVKMILELAQLMSTAHRMLDGNDFADTNHLYKKTHYNHPCAIWVRENSANYQLTFNLFVELCNEYSYRYNKVHKTASLTKALSILPMNITQSETATQIPCVMPDNCKVDKDHIKSYRNCYMVDKRDIAEWKNRPIPDWWI